LKQLRLYIYTSNSIKNNRKSKLANNQSNLVVCIKHSTTGITLVALVVTIVVLLILAGITLTYVMGDNSVFNRASDAKLKTDIANWKEKLELAKGPVIIDGLGTFDPDKYFEYIEEQGIIEDKETDVEDNEDGTYEVTTKPGYIYQIELVPTKENPKDAEIEYVGQAGELPPKIIKLTLTESDDKTSAQVSIEVKRGEGATYKYYWKEAGGEYGTAFYTGAELTQTITGLNLNEKTYIVKVEASNENGMTYKEEKMGIILSDGLLQKIAKIEESGVQTVSITGKNANGKPEEVTYSLNVMIYKGDLTLDGEALVDGSTLSNKVYSFGSAEDVSNGTERDAQNTVVLKVEGDLTINSGVTLTSVANAQGYGGPKGMIVYCTGKLTNDGTISMTARGARAEGQNVYLYKNANNSFEYVPSVGATGAVTASVNGKSNAAGLAGANGLSGSGRQTGGGGSGSALSYSWEAWTGAGGTGTSYSGGPGGGRFE